MTRGSRVECQAQYEQPDVCGGIHGKPEERRCTKQPREYVVYTLHRQKKRKAADKTSEVFPWKTSDGTGKDLMHKHPECVNVSSGPRWHDVAPETTAQQRAKHRQGGSGHPLGARRGFYPCRRSGLRLR